MVRVPEPGAPVATTGPWESVEVRRGLVLACCQLQSGGVATATGERTGHHLNPLELHIADFECGTSVEQSFASLRRAPSFGASSKRWRRLCRPNPVTRSGVRAGFSGEASRPWHGGLLPEARPSRLRGFEASRLRASSRELFEVAGGGAPGLWLAASGGKCQYASAAICCDRFWSWQVIQKEDAELEAAESMNFRRDEFET